MIMQAQPAKPITKTTFARLVSKAKSAPDKPLWINNLSSRVFPWGPRHLYCYLSGFSSGQCCLYDYRLAQKSGVSTRQLQRYLRWLRDHRLIHQYWYLGKHRRIVVNPYPSFHDWIVATAVPKPQKNAPKSARLSPLSTAEKEASRQRQQKALRALGGTTEMSYYRTPYRSYRDTEALDVDQTATVPPVQKLAGHNGCEGLAATAEAAAIFTQKKPPPPLHVGGGNFCPTSAPIKQLPPRPITDAAHIAETDRRRKDQLRRLYEVKPPPSAPAPPPVRYHPAGKTELTPPPPDPSPPPVRAQAVKKPRPRRAKNQGNPPDAGCQQATRFEAIAETTPRPRLQVAPLVEVNP